MKSFLIVGCGGFLGAGLRYFVGALALRCSAKFGLLLGTLTVNVAGCLLIGLLTGAAESRQMLSPLARLFLVVGLLGGFTTFSAFGLESFLLARGSEWARMALHAGAHMFLGLAAVSLGFWLGAR